MIMAVNGRTNECCSLVAYLILPDNFKLYMHSFNIQITGRRSINKGNISGESLPSNNRCKTVGCKDVGTTMHLTQEIFAKIVAAIN